MSPQTCKLPWYPLVVLLSVYMFVAQGETDITKFTAGLELFTIVRDPGKGNIYIGGRNVLLQLDPNLNIIAEVQKGGSLEPNDYKVLAISESKEQLLACGTADKGVCTLHSLVNISNFVKVGGAGKGHLVGSNNTAKVLLSDSELLYVFHQYDGRNLSISPPSMSLRELIEDKGTYKMLFLKDDAPAQMYSFLDVLEKYKPTYHMSFVDSFQHNQYLYVVTNQQKSVDDPDVARPMIGRKCYAADVIFRTYIETEIHCKNRDEIYSKVTSVAISPDDSMLYVTAARLKHRSPDIDKSYGSVLCKSTIRDLDDILEDTIFTCFFNSLHSNARPLEWNNDYECHSNQVRDF